ncbi:ankyrin repeat [Fusarium albosuccineum]|uniref:Ankyrin repeat n=1 Tax=Fusarium albosuccineum TaxID=1237068 RepID=A0A8H4PEV9_9HYPO|nr:ankyrin repeat [Fusarium albosuccineum]
MQGSGIASLLKPKAPSPEKSANEFGYHTLIHKDPLATNTVDVVAIHGLNGHYAKTWTDESTGVNWLQDLMPVGFFRVLSFSYNSSIKFSKSTYDLYDFADQLLEGLHASRQSVEEKQRPIIFVCHSFGGIVFKQAFVRAHEIQRYHDVGNFARGVLFFGTPHRGSSLAGWGTMLGPGDGLAGSGAYIAVIQGEELELEDIQLLRDRENGFHEKRDHQMGREGPSETNLCYFFFKSDNYDQRSGITALQSLIRQLCHKCPRLIPMVVDYLRGKSLEDLRALWLTFVASIQHIQAADDEAPLQVFCVLDGLDECDDARKLVLLISETFASTTGGPSRAKEGPSGGLLKMLVLSRPDNFIKNGFDKTPSGASFGSITRTAMIRLRGEDQIDSISADISRVVDVTISGLVQDGLPEDFLDDVRDQLIQRADRTFLWVTLIIQLLAAKADTGASRRDLDQILRSRDIDAVYSEMLATHAKASRARKMLSIILAAARPLTISEMSIALAITPDHNPLETGRRPLRPNGKTFSDLEYDLVLPFETHVKSICGNFVRIIHNKIYFIHETAREFLLELDDSIQEGQEQWSPLLQDGDPFENWYCPIEEHQPSTATPGRVKVTTGPWQHSFSLPTCEALLLHICTTFLYMMGKKCSNASLRHPSENTQDFLQYASMFWHRHFGTIQDMIAPRDLRYYENLCHPAFPGFTSWTTSLCGEIRAKQIAVGRSVDELQDYYIDLLGIELPCHTSDDIDMDFKGSRFEDVDSGPGDFKRHVNWQADHFSSNPASLSNHYFPTEADETGFVSLRQSLRQKRTHRRLDRITQNVSIRESM